MAKKSIPTWIVAGSSFIALLGLFVGGSLYFSPAQFMEGIDFTPSGVQLLTQMWAARQIAIAGAIGYSVYRKSVPMLQISLGIYCFMNVQDAIIGALHRDLGLGLGATLFGAFAGAMIVRLRRAAT